MDLSAVTGSDGLEYRYITPDTLKEVTDLVSTLAPAAAHTCVYRVQCDKSGVPLSPLFSHPLPSKVAASIQDLGKDANCSLICEGALHLRQFLHRRARQKNIELAPIFFTYFDLHTEFRKTFPRTPGSSLEEMARCILDLLRSSHLV